MHFKKNYVALLVTLTYSAIPAWADTAVLLSEIDVITSVEQGVRSSITRKEIEQGQPKDLKALFSNQLDVQVNDLQGSRAGNDGVNIRGLQGNRVAMDIDGIPLPESQESKLFVSFGQDFGAGNSIETTALRSANVSYSGSAQSLSGRVSFSTIEAKDLIQSGDLGGFISSGYNSLDHSYYSSFAGAAKNERYQGMLMLTGRLGHETKNKGDIAGTGAERTKSNPANYKNNYVLVKNGYQINAENNVNLTFEHQQRIKYTELASIIGTNLSIDPRRRNPQLFGFTDDETRRSRVSLLHKYNSELGFIQQANTDLYFQNAQTNNYRERQFEQGTRAEIANAKDKVFGIKTELSSFIDSSIPQLLRYGISYQLNHLRYNIDCSGCNSNPIANLVFDPSADTYQHKTSIYFEDEIALGKLTVTPHLSLLNYRLIPYSQNYSQFASEVIEVAAQNRTILLPKLNVEWNLDENIIPFFEYSRGIKTPSTQQLTSSFGNTVTVNGEVVRQYAVVGNSHLRPEIANNFSLGIKGSSEDFQYYLSTYYNKYKHFIERETRSEGEYDPLIQYQNQDKAKIYGITASAKVKAYDNVFVTAGVAYAKGHSEKNNIKSPINTIQPLKLKLGASYEKPNLGVNISLSHIRAKKNKDINGDVYNPTKPISLLDAGLYWKPIHNLVLSANVYNMLDKKYWNWTDISYFAVQNSSSAPDRTLAFNADNADIYTAPGRNFNFNIKYEF